MENYDPILNVKREIKEVLIQSDAIFQLIGNKDTEYPDDMMFSDIFPYMKDPNTVQEIKNAIYYEASDLGSSGKSGYHLDHLVVNFLVVCNSSTANLKMSTGDSRLDLLAEAIKVLFDKRIGRWIGEMILNFDKPYAMSGDFIARSLQFHFKDVAAC